MIHNLKEKYGFSSSVRYTELHRIINQIDRIVGPHNEKQQAALSVYNEEGAVYLDEKDSKDVVMSAVARLGYDLSEEDGQKVYDEFLRVAAKKKVGAKELDAIVASEALQVPAAYKLDSYVINNGNIISSSAQITLYKNGEKHQGVCIGDGPIDAAFLAIDQILGKHYELDDFQIQSVTEGKEAMGSAIVKLRSDGKV